MHKNEPVPVAIAWAALRNLADELAATHAPPFTKYFFEEHQAAIERVFQQLVNENQKRE